MFNVVLWAECRHGCLISVPLQPSQRVRGFSLARPAPVAELGHVDPAVAGLAAVDPGLGSLQNMADLPLGQSRFLAQLPEEGRNARIPLFVLGFGSHGGAGL